MVVLFVVMKGIRRYYARVEKEIARKNGPLKFPIRCTRSCSSPALHKPALRALAFAAHPPRQFGRVRSTG